MVLWEVIMFNYKLFVCDIFYWEQRNIEPKFSDQNSNDYVMESKYLLKCFTIEESVIESNGNVIYFTSQKCIQMVLPFMKFIGEYCSLGGWKIERNTSVLCHFYIFENEGITCTLIFYEHNIFGYIIS